MITDATLRSVAEVAIVLLPVIIAMLFISRRHEREANDRLSTMLRAFRDHEAYDRRVDEEVMERLKKLTSKRR